MAIPLGRSLPTASRDRPGRLTRKPARTRGLGHRAGRPYMVLLPVGFTVPGSLPRPRCALTAPFHPYPRCGRGLGAGGLLSVALSLGSPPPGVTRHRVSVEPGLSSSAKTPAAIRPSDPPPLLAPGARAVKRDGDACRRLLGRPRWGRQQQEVRRERSDRQPRR